MGHLCHNLNNGTWATYSLRVLYFFLWGGTDRTWRISLLPTRRLLYYRKTLLIGEIYDLDRKIHIAPDNAEIISISSLNISVWQMLVLKSMIYTPHFSSAQHKVQWPLFSFTGTRETYIFITTCPGQWSCQVLIRIFSWWRLRTLFPREKGAKWNVSPLFRITIHLCESRSSCFLRHIPLAHLNEAFHYHPRFVKRWALYRLQNI